MSLTKSFCKRGKPRRFCLLWVTGFLVLLLQFSILESANIYQDHIQAGRKIGAYIDFIDYNGIFLQSKNGTFALLINATYSSADLQSGIYYLSIMHKPSKVIIWVANRESPGSSSIDDEVVFNATGNLQFGNSLNLLWSTNTTNTTSMRLQENGNLVLLDAKSNTIWQSFDYPSDTLLEGQFIGLKPSQKLVSTISSTNMTSGSYSLSLDSSEGNLQLTFSGLRDPIQPYWSMASDTRVVTSDSGSPAYAVLNSSALNLVNKEGTPISQISFASSTLTRATLGPDGNLQIYVFNSGFWTMAFQSNPEKCQLPFFCGYLNICRGNAQCTCPGKLGDLDTTNPNKGCVGSTLLPCDINISSTSSQSLVIDEIDEGLDYFATKFASPLAANATDLDSCKKLCLSNCSCIYGLFYSETGRCFLYSQLGTLTRTRQGSSGAVLFAKGESSRVTNSQRNPKSFVIPLIIAAIAVVVILTLAGAFACGYFRGRTSSWTFHLMK